MLHIGLKTPLKPTKTCRDLAKQTMYNCVYVSAYRVEGEDSLTRRVGGEEKGKCFGLILEGVSVSTV